MQGQRPKFNVEEAFLDVTVIQMNDSMRELLSQFISEVDGVEREIVAFGKALQDPARSRELRREKRNRGRRRVYDDEAVA